MSRTGVHLDPTMRDLPFQFGKKRSSAYHSRGVSEHSRYFPPLV